MEKTNKNFLYNLVYQIFIFFIPLITIPYISRVLGVNNVGIYSYTYSIVNYFMLASMLGINNYGAREIAKSSSDILKKSKIFFSIYYLQVFCTIVMIIGYSIFIIFYKYEYKIILLIQEIYLISCAFDINWYFFGMEKFKITISRNIIIKIISLVFIFTFVKNKSDLWIYTLILSCSTLISQLYLWIFMNKEIIFTKVSIKEIFSHFRKCIILFIPVIAYSIYRIMDKTMIGSISDTIQLGNYESAEKIINIPLSIVSAIGTVMLPHMSKVSEDEFDKKVNDTFKLCFFMIFPIILWLIMVASDFSKIFFGNEFDLVPNIIKILVITILFSGITNIIRNTYLIPKAKDSIYVKSTIYGACINLILNLIFIKIYGAYGACVGTICAEFVVMSYQIIKTKKDIDYLRNFYIVIPFAIKSFIMGIVIFLIGLIFNFNIIIKITVQSIFAFITYFILNKNYILYDFLGKSKQRS